MMSIAQSRSSLSVSLGSCSSWEFCQEKTLVQYRNQGLLDRLNAIASVGCLLPIRVRAILKYGVLRMPCQEIHKAWSSLLCQLKCLEPPQVFHIGICILLRNSRRSISSSLSGIASSDSITWRAEYSKWEIDICWIGAATNSSKRKTTWSTSLLVQLVRFVHSDEEIVPSCPRIEFMIGMVTIWYQYPDHTQIFLSEFVER